MKTPFPFQVEGAQWLASRDRFGLHDEMGVGKTGTAIVAGDMVGAMRGIVICPAFLRENWLGEYREFSPVPRRICKGVTIHDFMAWLRGRYNILVTSYEQAVKWVPEISKSGEVIDFVIFDEAHYLKNADTKRVKQLLGPSLDGSGGSAIEWALHVWHLTGTPMSNDPLDIYTFLRMCFAVDLPKDRFIKTFFHKIPTTFGMRTEPKPEMLPELQGLIWNNAIRRTKRDVGIQLPPIFLTTVLVDGDTEAVRAMLSEHPGLEKAIVRAIELGGLSFIDSQHTSTLRRLVGEAKAVPYSHMLYEELTGGETDKRVVYGVHKDALATVHSFLRKHDIKSVIVNGEVGEKARVEAVRAFQNDDDCRVFIGNIRAAGTGVTLTASCEIDMLESDWSPGGNAQAIFRVHRIGQTRNVRARFVTLAKSIDEIVNKIVAAKTASIAQIEGEPMTSAPLDVLNPIA